MDPILVATKLRVPAQSRHVVHRARLIDALERGVPAYRLILVSAPAGYGKTTLLAQWAHLSRFRVAWLSIGEEDDYPERFLRCLLAAWEQIQPGIKDSSLGLLLRGKSPDGEAALSAFLNAADEVSDHTVFVLDDYHVIEDADIHQGLAFLLDRLPPSVHFVVAGRREPPLPLARYRARHQLLEFRAEDLHFSLDESSDFLNQIMGLDVTHEEVVSLQSQLEGWIAGLQLAALTIRRQWETTNRFTVSGRHRFIADYLGEEVLSDLPDGARSFLLQTSILEQLSGPLCDAVTERGGGQAMLEVLERRSLFLVPLDDNREWFRYHRLFADFLQEELAKHHPGELVELHRRAARWYLDHDLPEPAFRHSVAGDDPELTMQIGERYFVVKLHSGEYRVLRGWLKSLPEQWYYDYPMFDLIDAGVLAFTGAVDACLHRVDRVEQRLALRNSKDKRWHLARATAVRCQIACFQNDLAAAESYAARALQDLPEADFTFRADTYHALGDAYRRNGRWEEARQCYIEVLSLPPDPSYHIRSVNVHGALADLELRQGRLRGSVAHWEKALAIIKERETWGSFPLPLIGWVHVRMGEVAYEWNDLGEARSYLSRGLQLAELGGDVRAMTAGYVTLGRLKLTEGDFESSAEYLERARPLVEQAPFPDWVDRFERLQLDVWLAQGKLTTAAGWADEILRGDRFQGRAESELAQLAVARALIVKGDGSSIERVRALLQRLLKAAKEEGRTGITIEALALQALSLWRLGESAEAMVALELALRAAEPEGYVRLFADLGPPMARLLQEGRLRAVMPDYGAKLLAATAGAAFPSPAEQALPEPLTHREQEILELVAAGLTNREIADKLIISPETVKKHTGNIFGKLGVGSRTGAVARARGLSLLD